MNLILRGGWVLVFLFLPVNMGYSQLGTAAQEGVYKTYYPNGQVQVEHDIHAVRDGVVVSATQRMYREDGQLSMETELKENGDSFTKVYNENGQLSMEIIKTGQEVKHRVYSETGEVVSDNQYNIEEMMQGAEAMTNSLLQEQKQEDWEENYIYDKEGKIVPLKDYLGEEKKKQETEKEKGSF